MWFRLDLKSHTNFMFTFEEDPVYVQVNKGI